jgi:hypothetical protein
MQRSEDSSLPLTAVPPRIAAVFESKEWLDFVKSGDTHSEIIQSQPKEKNSINQVWF